MRKRPASGFSFRLGFWLLAIGWWRITDHGQRKEGEGRMKVSCLSWGERPPVARGGIAAAIVVALVVAAGCATTGISVSPTLKSSVRIEPGAQAKSVYPLYGSASELGATMFAEESKTGGFTLWRVEGKRAKRFAKIPAPAEHTEPIPNPPVGCLGSYYQVRYYIGPVVKDGGETAVVVIQNAGARAVGTDCRALHGDKFESAVHFIAENGEVARTVPIPPWLPDPNRMEKWAKGGGVRGYIRGGSAERIYRAGGKWYAIVHRYDEYPAEGGTMPSFEVNEIVDLETLEKVEVEGNGCWWRGAESALWCVSMDGGELKIKRWSPDGRTALNPLKVSGVKGKYFHGIHRWHGGGFVVETGDRTTTYVGILDLQGRWTMPQLKVPARMSLGVTSAGGIALQTREDGKLFVAYVDPARRLVSPLMDLAYPEGTGSDCYWRVDGAYDKPEAFLYCSGRREWSRHTFSLPAQK
jgi:hypothetical protein